MNDRADGKTGNRTENFLFYNTKIHKGKNKGGKNVYHFSNLEL